MNYPYIQVYSFCQFSAIEYWTRLFWLVSGNLLSQLMRLWYLSHRRQTKALASLYICAVSPEPSLFAHINYGSRRKVRPKIRHLAPLDDCACVFEQWIYGGQKATNSHELALLKGNKLINLTLSFYWNFAYCKKNVSLDEKLNKVSRSLYSLPWKRNVNDTPIRIFSTF